MSQITSSITDRGLGDVTLAHTSLIACNHCGIVALDTPAFGWKRWYDDDGELAHHCPAAVAFNEYIAQGLVHMKAPDEAIVYQDTDHWLSELVGAHDD